jgi:hypothetical protein
LLRSTAESSPEVRAISRARAIDHRRESFRGEWLEQIIQRSHLECLERVLVEGRDEHDVGHRLDANRVDHAEAVELRHLDVEKHELGLELGDALDGLDAGLCLADDLDVGVLGDVAAHLCPGGRFVVGDQNAHASLT